MAEQVHEKTARALRVYEYVDEDGVVFWSLTRLSGFSVHRLALVDVRGSHYRDHIVEIHDLAFESETIVRKRT